MEGSHEGWLVLCLTFNKLSKDTSGFLQYFPLSFSRLSSLSDFGTSIATISCFPSLSIAYYMSIFIPFMFDVFRYIFLPKYLLSKANYSLLSQAILFNEKNSSVMEDCMII